MKLKKAICTLAAIALANVAFAGNTSEMRVFIEGFFSAAEQNAQSEGEPSADSKGENTLAALKAGLLTYEAHLSARRLTELEANIHLALQKTIPATLNTVQQSLLEVQDELSVLLEQLTHDILANQQELKEENIDFDIARNTVAQFVFVRVIDNGDVCKRVSDLLQEKPVKKVDPRTQVVKFFASIEQTLKTKGDPFPAGKTTTTAIALKNGLMNYAEHKALEIYLLDEKRASAGQTEEPILSLGEESPLTPLDKEIDTTLMVTFPAIFNKIERTFLEVQEETLPVLVNLTTSVIGNQQTTKSQSIDNKAAVSLLSQFVFTKMKEDGSLKPEVDTILSAEMLDKLIDLQNQTEQAQATAAR